MLNIRCGIDDELSRSCDGYERMEIQEERPYELHTRCITDALSLKRAVLYLRVSTISQVHTDYDPEVDVALFSDAGEHLLEDRALLDIGGGFTRLDIFADDLDDLGAVTAVVLTDFFRDFQVASEQVASGRSHKSLKNITIDEWVTSASTADLLTDVALAGGSSKKSLVGQVGVEPTTKRL
jgi:hypothetical protein